MSLMSDAPAVLATQQPAETRQARRGPEIGYLILFVIFTGYMLIPLIGVGLFSVATTWFDTVLPVGYTVDHIVETLNDPLFVPTVGRSIIASLATIAVSVVLMTPVMFLIHVAAPRARPLVEFLSLLPFALPTIVLALSLIRTYSAPPIVLSGTPTLLILAYVVTGLPFRYRSPGGCCRAPDT